SSITTNSPNSISRVEDNSPVFDYFKSVVNFCFYLIHVSYFWSSQTSLSFLPSSSSCRGPSLESITFLSSSLTHLSHIFTLLTEAVLASKKAATGDVMKRKKITAKTLVVTEKSEKCTGTAPKIQPAPKVAHLTGTDNRAEKSGTRYIPKEAIRMKIAPNVLN